MNDFSLIELRYDLIDFAFEDMSVDSSNVPGAFLSNKLDNMPSVDCVNWHCIHSRYLLMAKAASEKSLIISPVPNQFKFTAFFRRFLMIGDTLLARSENEAPFCNKMIYAVNCLFRPDSLFLKWNQRLRVALPS
jgi:hypothetical protein